MYYVVYSVVEAGLAPFKVFQAQGDACSYATQQVQAGIHAKVYEVEGANSHLAAKAAIEMGKGTMIFAPTYKPSDQERIAAEKRAAAAALKELLS